MTNVEVELYMDRRLHLAPTNVAYLQEVGPTLKFHLCINQSNRHFIFLHRHLWRTHTTPPTTVLNHIADFPAAHTWPYLNQLFSSLTTLIPPECHSDTVSQIFAYAVESCANPGASVIDLAVVLTVVHPVITPRASVQIVDSVLIVDDEPEMTRGDWVGRAAVESVMIFDDEPIDIPRRPARRSARRDLKERYLLSASEAGDNLGDCAVCLEELKIIAGKSSLSEEVLKMPCSHVFHHRCISNWLNTNDTCPLCRAAIP